METIEHTLRGELRHTIERLKGLGGAVAGRPTARSASS
jgi:hypothetical protein